MFSDAYSQASVVGTADCTSLKEKVANGRGGEAMGFAVTDEF